MTRINKLTYHRQYAHDIAKGDILKDKETDRQLIQRLFSYLSPHWLGLLISFIFTIISKALEASVPIMIGYLLQSVLTERLSLNELIHFALIIITFMVLNYSLDAINIFIKHRIGQKALLNLREDVFKHIQELPLGYFDKHPIGALMTRTVHDVDQISQMFSESIVPLFGNLLLFICMFIGIIWIDWHIGLFVTALLPVVFGLTRNFRLQQRKCYQLIRSIVSAMNVFVQEHLMGLSTLRTFGLLKKERKKFEEINEDHRTAYLESVQNFSFFISSLDVMQGVMLISVFALLVLFTPPEFGFQAGKFFTFSLYLMMFFRPLADMAERYNILQSAMAAASRVFNVLDQTTELQKEKDMPTINYENVIHTILFEEVWFAYEGEDWILRGISFEIKRGESVALVGMTGSGKTTIISLLLRFYEIQKGSIKINGHDIKNIPLRVLRSYFSVVLQDPVIFSGTVADNITLYNPEIKREVVQKVLRKVDLERTFKEGIDHHLGEGGGALSAGEMQLVSIARAMAHDREVLVLDEATANIDTGTERRIQEALQKILKNKTAIVIAHRLSTIKYMTKIIVLHQGVIKEMGSHEELLALKGVYEKLYRLHYTL